MTQPVLNGLTVLELGAGSHPAALAGVQLADNGARVIKVEPPEGDRMREASPSGFLVLNRGKESIVADLRTAGGRDKVCGLAARADVLIEAFAPGVAETFGVDYERLREVNPALVHCSINGFGSTGRYAKLKAYDQVVQAKTGVFMLGAGGYYGYREGPIFVNAPVASTGAGQLAAAAITAALIAREQTGRGQHVEVPMYTGATIIDYYGVMHWLYDNGKLALPPRQGGGARPAAGVFASRIMYVPCTKDGRFVFFSALLPHQAHAVLRALGIERLLADPRYANTPAFATAEDAQAYEDEIWEVFRTRTYKEWEPILRAEPDIAYELARTCEEGLDHPQVRRNGEVIELADPGFGNVEQVGPVARFLETPARPERSAPTLNEHGGPLAGPLARTGTAQADLVTGGPLSGFTIVEFGYFYAMPFADSMAAALGARVIKIEDLSGDPIRKVFGAPETGAERVMAGKESLAVDMRSPEGREIVLGLIAKADAFVNSFRPGIAERQGLGYEMLQSINPGIVYLHATGYGLDGEFADRAIYAGSAMAAAGSTYRQAGFWMDPALTEGMSVPEIQAVILPRLRAVADGDSNAAAATFTALMLALYHKRRTGRGQFLSTSMLGGNLWAYADDAIRYPGKTPVPAADPDLNGTGALYRLYQVCAGWVFLAAPRQKEWEQFAAAIGRDDLLRDPRFATAADRSANDEALAAELGKFLGDRTASEWEELLAPQGIGCVAAYEGTMSQFAATDAVVRETDLVAEVTHPVYGKALRYRVPARFSETPALLRPACVAGQHSAAIMAELGYSAEQIAELADRKVVLARSGD